MVIEPGLGASNSGQRGSLQGALLQSLDARARHVRAWNRAELSGAGVVSADLTSEEQANVRAALHFLHLRSGRWATLGRALRFHGYNLSNVANGHRDVTAKLVLRIAKLAGVGFDDVLMGKFPPAGVCPHCGSHVDTGRATNETG